MSPVKRLQDRQVNHGFGSNTRGARLGFDRGGAEGRGSFSTASGSLVGRSFPRSAW